MAHNNSSLDIPKIPWIFFDLDDTIWNFSENSMEALKKLYEAMPILRKFFKSIDEFIDIYHKNNFRLWDLYSQGKVSTNQLKVERWRSTLATKQFEVLTAVCEELDKTYLDILAKETRMIPGVAEMLSNLTKSCLLAVLSNGFSNTQYKKLKYSGLWKYITRTIVSEEIGINKPDERLFKYAVDETGATSPLLMVGDHPSTDIYGAMKAGWYAIWYNPAEKPFPYSEQELRDLGVNPSLLLASVKNMDELENQINLFLKNIFNKI